MNLYVIEPINLASSSQKIEGTEKLNNITRKKETTHTVGMVEEINWFLQQVSVMEKKRGQGQEKRLQGI